MKFFKTKLILMIILILNIFTFTAFAQTSSLNTLNIYYKYNNISLSQVTFNLYQVSTDTVNNPLFSDFTVDFSMLNNAEYVENTGNSLTSYISKNNISADITFSTNTDGEYSVEDLETGLYYLKASNKTAGNYKYSSSPILVYIQNDGSEIDISPKISRTRVSTSSTPDTEDEDDVEPETPDEPEIPDEPAEPEIPEIPDEPETPDTPDDGDLDTDEGDPNTPPDDSTGEGQTTPDDPNFGGSIDPPDSSTGIPQTGSSAYKIPIFAGFGLIFILLGNFLKSKGATDET